MMPVICTLGGDRQGSSFAGALSVYMGSQRLCGRFVAHEFLVVEELQLRRWGCKFLEIILTFVHSFICILGSCYNHLHNVWIGAIEIHLSRRVTQILVEELALIPPHLHVKCNIGNVCRCVDKEFNFTANYPKGHGNAFHDWMRRFHPGKLMMPVIRTLGGDR
jgi:hypothetical protein